MSGSDPTIEDLKDVIRLCPAIDNHAHNLLLPTHQDSYSLLSATTEATGDALQDTVRSLPHLRMVRQLRELYGCDPTAGWDQLMSKRAELIATDSDSLFRRCFQGVHTILMDDGLDDETVHPYNWHDQFTPEKTFRIVRIETVAADILRGMYESGSVQIGRAIDDEEYCAEVWITFLGAFEQAIVNFIGDDEVVAFKSVVCYRTGLDVEVGPDVEVATNGLDAFRDYYLPRCVEVDFRVECKGLNDCLLISTCRLLTAGALQTDVAKPLQFHTGLGDNDISLLRSDPSHLQPLIEKFPDVQFILLHSSYPYTRQAGYLATVFKNLYLDLGEVFPMVSRDGQERIIRQAMELTPISKLLYSTDAHYWAEVYWLADKQFRQAFERVLLEYVEYEDLTVQQAIDVARDIYFHNANRVYDLDLELPELTKTPLQLTWEEPAAQDDTPSIVPNHADKQGYNGPLLLQAFTKTSPGTQFVYVQWLDYMATMRTRIFPLREFRDLVENEGRFSIASGSTGILQDDSKTPVVESQGHIFVKPDLTTIKRMHSKDPINAAAILASFEDQNGLPLHGCPRSILQELVTRFETTQDITFLTGFEIELVLLRRGTETNEYHPSDTNHAWSTFTPGQVATVVPILAEIVSELGDMGIHIQQFHSESGAGQYELVLPPLPIVAAIDTLIQARQVTFQIAHSYGYRATLHPNPLGSSGSGQHAHISLNSTTLSLKKLCEKEMSFFAAVLQHLPSICAFSMPNQVSYERVKEDAWAGGIWCCWGTQNREVPLRRVVPGRWEFRCLDGLANPYLALGAVLAAGLEGVERVLEMEVSDCRVNPARLDEQQRKEMGITRKLPVTLDDALAALETDSSLAEGMNPEFVSNYLAMKRAEKEKLGKMEESERRAWLIERY